jgi:tetratricopeptide (TPR) repeat protein
MIFGRDDERLLLVSWLNDPSVRAVCVYGASGVGKTALVNDIFNTRDLPRFAERRYRLKVPLRGADAEKGDRLQSAIADNLFIRVPPESRPEDRWDAVLRAVRGRPTLLLINSDECHPPWFAEWIEKWVNSGDDTYLLLTTLTRLDPGFLSRQFRQLELTGFAESQTDAILGLLGDDLRLRFPREFLLARAKELQNLPRHLAFLRMHDPTSEEEMTELTAELSGDRSSLIRTALNDRTLRPITHFLALGRASSVTIDERLFGWLWRHLGGGAADAYVRVRDELIRRGLLTRDSSSKDGVLRINANVCVNLERELERAVGPLHIPHVDYYLSEYYRQIFAEYKQEDLADKSKMNLLTRYVIHAYRANNLRDALEFVLNSERLRAFHHNALAPVLRPVFYWLNSFIDRSAEMTADQPDPALLLQHALVKVELAHCESDLGRHEESLPHLDEAEQVLRLLPAAAKEDGKGVLQQVEYLRGVVHSRCGQSLQSIRAYHDVVRQGLAESFGELEILALCYLAFEVRFIDNYQAMSLGESALKLAKESEVGSIIAKVQCSLAQIYLFQGHIEEADRLLHEASASADQAGNALADKRERGRILLCRAEVRIAQRRHDEAVTLLRDAFQLNRDGGDMRRCATSNALQGIALWRKHDPGWQAPLRESIEEHRKMGDWRNAIQHALSYGFMAGENQPEDAALKGKYSNEFWVDVIRSAPPAQRELIGRYWDFHFRPALLSWEAPDVEGTRNPI